MFSVSYDGVSISPVPLNSMTAETLQRTLNNITSVTKQGHVTVTELVTSRNSTAYRVTFYFKNPEQTQMLLSASVSSNVTSVNISRLQKGKAQVTVSYSEPSGSSGSGWSPWRRATRPAVRDQLYSQKYAII